MSGRIRSKNGRLAKQKVIDHRKKSLEAMARAKKEKRKKEKEQREKQQQNVNLCQGFRVINLQELGKNLNCTQCKQTLSLENVTVEAREGLHSILTVNCLTCNIQNTACTGRKVKINSHTYSDVNLSAVLGTTYSGIGCTELNKLLSCLDVPSISNDLYKRYEAVVGPAIETAAKESCKLAAEEERRLVIENLETLSETL